MAHIRDDQILSHTHTKNGFHSIRYTDNSGRKKLYVGMSTPEQLRKSSRTSWATWAAFGVVAVIAILACVMLASRTAPPPPPRSSG